MDYQKKDTNFLKFIAILLITNSHLDQYYPISNLATGGAIGNSLFFMLSTFGLLLSERANPRSFFDWYNRRIIRIYPSVWVACILFFIPVRYYFNMLDSNDIFYILSFFFYPPFWFLKAIMIYYFFVFFIIKNYNVKKFYVFFFSILIVYMFGYFFYLDLSVWSALDLPLSALFYFTMFISGIYVADNNHKIKYSGFQDYIFLFISFLVIYLHKYLITKNILVEYQFIELLFLFPLVFYALKISRSDFIQKRIMDVPFLSKIIIYISGITLELYMVQDILALPIREIGLPFPINIIVFLISIFIAASLIKYLSKYILSFVQRIK